MLWLCVGGVQARDGRPDWGKRHSSLRRRRHVATFALTWRAYCLCRTATTRLNFCGAGPRLNGQRLGYPSIYTGGPTIKKLQD